MGLKDIATTIAVSVKGSWGTTTLERDVEENNPWCVTDGKSAQEAGFNAGLQKYRETGNNPIAKETARSTRREYREKTNQAKEAAERSYYGNR